MLNRILPYWVGAAIAAGVSVLYTLFFSWAEKLSFAWGEAIPQWGIVIIPAGIMLSMMAAHFFAPTASGSGIPQMIAAVEIAEKPSPLLERLLSFPMMIVKISASALCVAAGGITGREGPNLQVAAAIFYQVGKYWPKALEKVNSQSMVLAGGAAGLAAAFNTPLGGIVFAIEELANVHISLVRTAVFHSVLISGILAQAAMGNYLYLGKVSVTASSGLLETAEVAVAGILIGILGAVFGWAVVWAVRKRSSLKVKSKFAFTLMCAIPVVALFYAVGPQNLGSGRGLILDLLEHPQTHASLGLALGRGFGNFFTFAGGVVGGIFAPALATGACFGSWLSQFLPDTHSQLWVLAGMVAFLTGVTRTPFTSMILVLEMTDSHEVILDLMLAAILAHAAAKLVDSKGFYTRIGHAIAAEARD